MRRIWLTHGGYATVDDEDYSMLMEHRWTYRNKEIITRTRTDQWTMAAMIMQPKRPLVVMHKNHNNFWNVRSNLVVISRSVMIQITRQKRVTTSQYRGVCWMRKNNLWRAQVMVNRQNVFLGEYATELEAAIAYDRAALEVFGPNAVFNFPEEVLTTQEK